MGTVTSPLFGRRTRMTDPSLWGEVGAIALGWALCLLASAIVLPLVAAGVIADRVGRWR